MEPPPEFQLTLALTPQCCGSEYPIFLKVFQAVPTNQLDWRPHPTSRSANELLGHLVGHEQDLVELADTGAINHRNQVPLASVDQALQLYKQAHQALEAKLATLDDRTWDEKSGKFMVQGNVIYDLPYGQLMWMLLFDAIHHRGQLSTYLRPMGGKVPSMYGPSADDVGGH